MKLTMRTNIPRRAAYEQSKQRCRRICRRFSYSAPRSIFRRRIFSLFTQQSLHRCYQYYTISEDDGATYNQAWLLNTIEDLTYDSANRGILLYVDSPGGTVYESDEAYLALMDYKKATERPIIAYIASTGCSGAYYISCAADEIYANRNALTGSIGVIMGS